MIDFNVGAVIGMLARTLPFLAFRFLIYFGITLGYVLATGVGAGVGYFIGFIGDNPGAYGVGGGLLGFALASVVMYFLREYLLYLVKAGHIAVLVELMDGRELPGGRAQIDHAQRIVRERFAESSVLFALDQLLKAVLRAFNRTFFTITWLIPIPGLQWIVNFANTIVNLSLTYVDEVILAHNIRTGSDNPWRSGQTGVILYAQNYKAFLKNAFFLAFLVWGLTLVVFVLALAPAAGIVALFPGTAGALTVVFAVVFAWGVKQAVIEPFAMTALMQVFFKVTQGQQPDPAWDARLDKLSRKFRGLKERADTWTEDDKPAAPAAQAPLAS